MNYNRGKIAISARIMFLRDNKILLGLRAAAEYAPGKWMLPGGTTDRYETALESAVREAREEVGLIVKPEDLEFLGMVHWYKANNDVDGATFNWICRKWSSERPDSIEPVNKEVEKCVELRWMSVDDIEDMAQNDLVESTSLAIIREFAKGRAGVYVECDWPENFDHLKGKTAE